MTSREHDGESLFREGSDWQEAALKRMKKGHAWPGVVKPRDLSFQDLGIYEAGFAAGQAHEQKLVDAKARRKRYGQLLSASATQSQQKANRTQEAWYEGEDVAHGHSTPFSVPPPRPVAVEVKAEPHLKELQAIARQARRLQQVATVDDAKKKHVARERERLFALAHALANDAFGG